MRMVPLCTRSLTFQRVTFEGMPPFVLRFDDGLIWSVEHDRKQIRIAARTQYIIKFTTVVWKAIRQGYQTPWPVFAGFWCLIKNTATCKRNSTCYRSKFPQFSLCQNVDFHFIVRFEDRATETGPRRHPLNNKVSDKLPRVDQLTIDIQFLNLLSQVFFHGLPIELFPAGF